ncbi:MAG: DUF2190 family protein [Paracoccus sp. BP8]|nr:MAG: DUF2190 family protein [Paracoccus sp. BP8]
MKNYVQVGQTITIHSPAAVTSGAVVVAGNFAGIACGDAEAGALLNLRLEGVFALPKVAADAIAVGDPVFFDSAAGLVTTTATDNARHGTATQAAPAGSAAVRVRLVQL